MARYSSSRRSSSRRSINFNSSSAKNSLTYVMRSRRIAESGTNTHLHELDTIKRVSRCWDAYGNKKTYIREDYDKLQYIMAFSNLDRNPADLCSMAKGRAVTAENLYEEAADLDEDAKDARRKAELLLKYAHKFGSPTFFEMADRYMEDAEESEKESQHYYDWAVEQEKAAEYWEYEAETIEAEERFVSNWESWLDID